MVVAIPRHYCRRRSSAYSSLQKAQAGATDAVKLFYTGPAVNAEMLVVMLEKHGIEAKQEFVDTDGESEDLNRDTKVLVPEGEYDRAWRLFYAEREDEL